ncbi:MAG: hypothetical protein QXZ63_06690 [Sulfolobales archaeon]
MINEEPLYKQIYDMVVDLVSRYKRRRGIFTEVAKHFYPDLYEADKERAVKLVYAHYLYAKTRLRSKSLEFLEEDLEDNIMITAEYNGLDNSSGPIKQSRFFMESRNNRKSFELKKMAYAVLQEFIPKARLSPLIEGAFTDQRVQEIISSLESTVWYNGTYVKIDKTASALLYIICIHIYVRYFGAGNTPTKLLKKLFEVTSYSPHDLQDELRKLTSVFYDWLLLLDS